MNIVSVLGALVLIVLLLPLFLSSHLSMSRSVGTQAPVPEVFSKLTNLNEYAKWGFPEGDPTHQTTVTGIGLNSFLIWNGKRTGEGKMTITNIERNKKVSIKMEVQKPMISESLLHLITSEKAGSNTELTWTFEQDLTYIKRYFGLFMNAMMGKHVQDCLNKFKLLAESNPVNERK